MFRILYILIGMLLGVILCSVALDTEKVEKMMYSVARNSYLVGCIRKEKDCEKGADTFEDNLKKSVSF